MPGRRTAASRPIEGRCLCGAVLIRVAMHRHEIGICHCSICRRWSGSALAIFGAAPEAVVVEGARCRAYRASSFAERAFCGTCGCHLWFREDDGDYELAAGLFEAAAGYPLISEIYTDQALRALDLAGDHKRATTAEYEAKYPSVNVGDLR